MQAPRPRRGAPLRPTASEQRGGWRQSVKGGKRGRACLRHAGVGGWAHALTEVSNGAPRAPQAGVLQLPERVCFRVPSTRCWTLAADEQTLSLCLDDQLR